MSGPFVSAHLFQLATAEEMKVKVRHLLTGLWPRVYHHPVALLRDPLPLCQLIGDMDQVSQELLLVGADLGQGWNVGFGHDQEVDWCRGVDIAEGDSLIILINDIAGNLTSDDATEDTVHFFALCAMNNGVKYG